MDKSARNPAKVYDEDFVPALFGPWASTLCKLAGISQGDAVLDVACGTGVLACVAARQVGASGTVIGLDPNEEMLDVARQKRESVEWKVGPAEAIPYEDCTFNAVLSQFGFMFFDDPVGSLREMMRVLKPGGKLIVAVCDAVDHSPGYAVFTELLHRLFGSEVAQGFRAPFALGDRKKLISLCKSANIDDAEVQRHEGQVRFSSIDSLVSTERACAWTLGGVLSDDQFAELREAARETLEPFRTENDRCEFSLPALIIVAQKH